MADSSSNDVLRQVLEKQRDALQEDLQAVTFDHDQAGSYLERTRIGREKSRIEKEIQEVEEKLRELPLAPSKKDDGGGGCFILIVLGILVLVGLSQNQNKQSGGSANDVTSTPPVQVTVVAPQDFVRNYYEMINQRRYAETWGQLSPQFRQTRSNNDYEDYVVWWDSVDLVQIGQVILQQSTGTDAIVYIELWYHLKSGQVIPDPEPHYFLTLDRQQGNWLINSKGQ